MSGHSKWSTIKHKKGAADAKRGKLFTKLIKEITVAARMGGGDQTANPRLRMAIAAAKAENMPKNNMERAIKKGTGELDGVDYEEIVYEGYGPGGAAVIVEALTDNKNRAVADIRHIFNKCNGNLGANGCVAWMFDKKGIFIVDKKDTDEEQLMEIAIDAGAEDVKDEGDTFEVITEPSDFEPVKNALEAADVPFHDAEVTLLPQNMSTVTGKDAEQMIKMMDMLDDCDDVQKVYTNADIPEDVIHSM